MFAYPFKLLPWKRHYKNRTSNFEINQFIC